MTTLKDLLALLVVKEEVKLSTQQLADQIEKEFEKADSSWTTLRTGDRGTPGNKLYKMVKDKNYNNGETVAMFRVPIIQKDPSGNALNNNAAFKKVIDKFWSMRSQGIFLSQPQGGKEKSDYWEDKNSGTIGNIMTFYVAGNDKVNESVITESDDDLHELLDKWMDANRVHSFEGERGVRNFEKLLQSLNSDYNDLHSFFADNSGAVEAVLNWIQDSNVPEWADNLRNETEE